MNIIKKVKQYFLEVKSEAKKVSWPSKQVTLKHSFIVIMISLATAAFLGGIDYFLTYLMEEFVNK